MRTLAILGWLSLPVLVGAYHYGPGQQKLKLDDVSQVLARADRLSSEENWSEALVAYNEALEMLPSERVSEIRKVRLERAKVQMFATELPEARNDLKVLVEELDADKSADPELVNQAREALANAQYYVTWLLRLEGLGREDWEPEIESARQIYRLLAEQAENEGDSSRARKRQEDLESVIRLARMDLGELQGLALPSQCQGCKDCAGRCNGKKPGRKPSKSGNKAEDARGASSGPPPDGAGS
ncbi:hypothetical protein BH23PLA1_BH23PLA1_36940 [soil metagenome]